MLKNKLKRLDKKTLRRWLLVFFFSLAIPTALLIQQSYSRLKWEAFHQYQVTADELAVRIDNQLLQLIAVEEQRPFTDYSFLNVVGEPAANFFQRSPLSQYPVESDIPGMIGYFQVDTLGQLMTPLIPDLLDQSYNYGISETELAVRTELHNEIQSILTDNRLVKNIPTDVATKYKEDIESEDDATQDSIFSDLASSRLFSRDSSSKGQQADDEYGDSLDGQAAFDELQTIPKEVIAANKLGRLEDLKLEQRYQLEAGKQSLMQEKKDKSEAEKKVVKRARQEKSILPEATKPVTASEQETLSQTLNEGVASPVVQGNLAPLTINTFSSEIEPFEFSQLASGHFVLYRKVWRNEQRYIQGFLIEQQAFLAHVVNATFRETALSQMTNLLVAYQGNVLEAFSGQTSRGYLSSASELYGELLYQTNLSAPLSDLQLLFSITQLPAGAGGTVVLLLALILACVLCVGFYLMYRLSVGQINLANQQQDFVSAVSHELKTPLTSIRMYGEMLREGWASEEKKKSYYDFIFDESERLSRLINNVLLMAKLTRNSRHVALKPVKVSKLMDGIRSKVSTQIEHADYELALTCENKAEESTINVDEDWFSQIMINLVDNAIKFSAKSQTRKIDITCQKLMNGQVQFKVRDYGPGIAKQQMKKIFQLFYRSESELTRETVGTGIGLALVHQ